MTFTRRLVNRLTMPTKHVLIVEDDIEQQRNLLGVFQRLFGHQGHVQVSVVPGAEFAACVYDENVGISLIVLDHDLPHGNGRELLEYLFARTNPYTVPPVLTASGIPSNNDALMAAGANYKFTKAEIIEGNADALLQRLLAP